MRQFEKFRSTDQALLTIAFDTKVSGWSWGSRWKIEVRPIGDGCVATAHLVSAGSLIAGTSEAKKIKRIFDLAESMRPTPPPAAGGGETSRALAAIVQPNLPPQHQHLIRPVLQALDEAEIAAAAHDVVDEELALVRAQRTAASAGGSPSDRPSGARRRSARASSPGASASGCSRSPPSARTS